MVLDYRPVTNAPLPKMAPIPDGDWDMQISWGRTEGWMNLKIPDLYEGKWIKGVNEWAFKECGGRSVITGCDPKGRISLRASAKQDGDMIRFWRPEDAEAHPVFDGQLLETASKPHYRMCFFIGRGLWRVLDENPDSPQFRHLELGKGYIGDWKMNWNERGSHLFQNGPIIIDDKKIFHLYDPLLTKF